MADRPVPTTTYERPVEARLHVNLTNGDTWEASAADLAKFGLITRDEACAVLREQIVKALESAHLLDEPQYHDIDRVRLHPLWQLFQDAMMAPSESAPQHLVDEVVAMEQVLRTSDYTGLR